MGDKRVLACSKENKSQKQKSVTCIEQGIIWVVLRKIVYTNSEHWTEYIRTQVKHNVSKRFIKNFFRFFEFVNHPYLSGNSQVFVGIAKTFKNNQQINVIPECLLPQEILVK